MIMPLGQVSAKLRREEETLPRNEPPGFSETIPG